MHSVETAYSQGNFFLPWFRVCRGLNALKLLEEPNKHIAGLYKSELLLKIIKLDEINQLH